MDMDQTQTYIAQMTRAMDVLLPLETDDEFISEYKVMKQPEGQCSLVAGLNGVTAVNMTLLTTNPADPGFTSYGTPPIGFVERQEGQHAFYVSDEELRQHDALRAASEQIRKLEHCLDGLHKGLSPSFETPRDGCSPRGSELITSQLHTMRANLHVSHLWAQNSVAEQIRTSSDKYLHGKALSLMDDLCWKTQERVGRQLLDLLRTLPRINVLRNGMILVSLV